MRPAPQPTWRGCAGAVLAASGSSRRFRRGSSPIRQLPSTNAKGPEANTWRSVPIPGTAEANAWRSIFIPGTVAIPVSGTVVIDGCVGGVAWIVRASLPVSIGARAATLAVPSVRVADEADILQKLILILCTAEGYGGGATRAQADSSERGGGYESQFDSRHVDSPIEDGSKLASFSKVPDGKPWESVRGSDGHDAPGYHTARSGLFNPCI